MPLSLSLPSALEEPSCCVGELDTKADTPGALRASETMQACPVGQFSELPPHPDPISVIETRNNPCTPAQGKPRRTKHFGAGDRSHAWCSPLQGTPRSVRPVFNGKWQCRNNNYPLNTNLPFLLILLRQDCSSRKQIFSSCYGLMERAACS